MSGDMPRTWWSPSLAAAKPGTPLAGLLWSFVSGEYVEPSNLPLDAVELKPVSVPAAPVVDTLCASCSHRAGTHLDGVGDCAAGSLYAKCRCDGFEAPPVQTEAEWALTYGNEKPDDKPLSTWSDVRRQYDYAVDKAPTFQPRMWRRTVTRSGWREVRTISGQEVTDDG